MILSNKVCVQCGMTVESRYCSNCGQSFPTKRLTLFSVLHEIFHFFTHLEKGFLFTLIELIKRPGTMQRAYISGQRSRYQKPFSMFFLSATFTALLFYWINTAILKYYRVGDINDTSFFHQYMVITQILLLPVYALITYLFFIKSEFNYAEVLVQRLYTFSILLLVVGLLQNLKFIWPDMETRYLELPVAMLYSVITNIHFFRGNKSINIIKTVAATIVSFSIAALVQDFLIKLLA